MKKTLLFITSIFAFIACAQTIESEKNNNLSYTISTKNLDQLPNSLDLKNLCKSISAIEAIIMEEWGYRYYSYNKNWGKNEELFEMRNGSGDQMLVLFQSNGTVINGFAHESEMNGWTSNSDGTMIQNIWKGVLENLPQVYKEFVYGEPVKSIGTTFCIWSNQLNSKWEIGEIEFPRNNYLDGSKDLLTIFDKNPDTYRNWAIEYYELDEINIDVLTKIYNMEPITMEMVKLLNPSIENIENLKLNLNEIGFQHLIN